MNYQFVPLIIPESFQELLLNMEDSVLLATTERTTLNIRAIPYNWKVFMNLRKLCEGKIILLYLYSYHQLYSKIHFSLYVQHIAEPSRSLSSTASCLSGTDRFHKQPSKTETVNSIIIDATRERHWNDTNEEGPCRISIT